MCCLSNGRCLSLFYHNAIKEAPGSSCVTERDEYTVLPCKPRNSEFWGIFWAFCEDEVGKDHRGILENKEKSETHREQRNSATSNHWNYLLERDEEKDVCPPLSLSRVGTQRDSHGASHRPRSNHRDLR
jgi:hypothetical protein